MPKVTVVIPSYNSAADLRGALESVFRQTYRNFEVVVVDDGSSDNTETVVNEFCDRLIYLKQERRGASAARNRGIQAGCGEYVAFLDADDVWLPQKLAEQIPCLDQDCRTGIVCSDGSIMSDGREVLASYLGASKHARNGYAFDAIIQENFILTSSVVVRRRCLDEVGLFDESLHSVEDRDLWMRIAHGWNVAIVPKLLVKKRNHPSGLSSDLTLATRSRIQVFQKALAAWPDLAPRSRSLIRKQLSQSYFEIGYYFFKGTMQQDARENLLCCLRLNWHHSRALVYLSASYFPPGILKMASAIKQAIS